MDSIQLDFENCILEKPYGFSVGKERFYLYPVTLGKSIFLKSHIESLNIDFSNAADSTYDVALKAVKEHKDEVLFIIAVYTIGKARHCLYTEVRNARIEELAKSCNEEDLTTLLILCLTKDKNIKAFREYLHLDTDNIRKQVVLDAKKSNDNIYTFGGKSILGSFIDVILERYHWSYQYVLWEISLETLQMLMMDKISTIYLTDEEKKNCHVPNDTNNSVMADDPNNNAMLESMFGSK